MMKSKPQITKHLKSMFALIAFTVAGTVFAQESVDSQINQGFTSYGELQDAVDNIRLNINPFSSESLRLYELRREVERLELQEKINHSEWSASDIENFKTSLNNYGKYLENIDQKISNLELEISELLAQAVSSAETAAEIAAARIVNESIGIQFESVIQSNVFVTEDPPAENETADAQDNKGLTYGYVDFGLGPRLYYGSAGRKRFAGVNDYVLLPISGGKIMEVKITEITEAYALLDNGDRIIFSDARNFLNAPPDKAFGETK